MVNISLRVLSRPDAVESPTMYPICKEVSKSAVDEFNTSPFIPQRQQVALVSQVFERVDGRIAVLPPRFSSYFFSRRCFSSNPADDPKKPNEPNVPKLPNRKKEDYEKMLEKLELQYGPTPDPDVVLRQLAICAVDLDDVRDERIAAQKDLVQYRRCLGVYKFRPRIDVAEVKYLKGANLSDGKLRKILTVDESKVNAVSAKIIEAYNSASRDHQEITLNLEDIETKIQLIEADIRSSSLRKATRHYLRWKYIFRFSSYKEIKGLRQVLSEEEIDELCSDISILWILAGPVHHIPLSGLTIKKEDALFGFEVLEFKSEYSTKILELLY